ncbi:uncharacterized protein LOC134036555 [Osmerus eperlanus]|uniref:uncharacterized protein LOC134036555 n=1 Tax=Osmerus eperlanus TaxID=29151 RepID=UPI002E14E2B8
MFLCLIWLVCKWHLAYSEDVITPFTDVVLALEGDRVTLSCNYSGTVNNLQWYLQNPRSVPQFLTMEHMDNNPGFSVKHEREKRNMFTWSSPLLNMSVEFSLVCCHSVSQTLIMFSCFIFVIAMFVGNGSAENGIYSDSLEERVMFGDSGKLSCNYSLDGTGSLLWYRQYPRSAPLFLLLVTSYGSSKETVVPATPPYPRLSVYLNKERNRVDLSISSAEVTDSALYYCALQPTVTGNPDTLYKNPSISTQGTIRDSYVIYRIKHF